MEVSRQAQGTGPVRCQTIDLAVAVLKLVVLDIELAICCARDANPVFILAE
jgi:hypothetical protein